MARQQGAARPPPEPDAADLHEAALRHLARYAASVAGVVRMLDRRVSRWARATAAEAERVAQARQQARQVVARLAETGVLDDATYAAGRSRSLARAGKSTRAISAHLAARGVDREVARAALPSDREHDLAAAVVTMRRRRIGPFRAVAVADAEPARRELAALARAGFSEGLARRALALSREEADALTERRRAAP